MLFPAKKFLYRDKQLSFESLVQCIIFALGNINLINPIHLKFKGALSVIYLHFVRKRLTFRMYISPSFFNKLLFSFSDFFYPNFRFLSAKRSKYNQFFHPGYKSTPLRDRFGVGPLFWRRAGTK